MPIKKAALNQRDAGFLDAESLGGNAQGIIKTETRRGRPGRLISVIFEIQQVKSIRHVAAARLCGLGFLSSLDWEGLLEWLSTLVDIPLNLAVLVFPVKLSAIDHCKLKANYPQSAHHACPSKHRIVHRVGFDEAATTGEFYLDNNEIVNMI